MNPRTTRKKLTISPLNIHNIKKKPKSKSKSKEKAQKIISKEFLDALIDLQNTNCSTNRKKKSIGRDISSALTVATPILQKSIQASKIRCKSSLSQYRKKGQGRAPIPLAINLQAVITEQDYIQYTQKTVRSCFEQEDYSVHYVEDSKDKKQKALNPNICAIKIQRAWRNYQTYKMVHQIYLKERKIKQCKSNGFQRELTNHLNVKIKKLETEKTLKIRKQPIAKKYQERQEVQAKTKRQEKVKVKSSGSQKLSKGSPIFNLSSSQQLGSKESLHSDKTKTNQLIKEAERFNQVIDLIEKQGKVKTKQELLNDLITKFQVNKKSLEDDLEKQMLFIEQSQNFELIPPKTQTNQEDLMKVGQSLAEYQKINIKDFESSESSMNLDYDSMAEEMAEFKVFTERLKMIKDDRLKRLQKIDYFLFENKITNEEATRRKEQIYDKYQKQKKDIEKQKRRLLFSLSQLKKSAIQCQKSYLTNSLSFSKLRKSFSVGNTVIKQVLQEIKIVQISRQSSQKFFVYGGQSEQFFQKEELSKPLISTPTPNISFNTPEKSSQTQEQLVEKNNTDVMKEYSEEIQELIEKELIDEFVKKIFLEQNLFMYFRPYIQEIYEFKKIPDNQIFVFLQSIKDYFPQENLMLSRINQKINPSSVQILRIIRDLDFEIDEYELIIPEETFKKYRASIEKDYEQQNKSHYIDEMSIRIKVKDQDLVDKVYRLEIEKQDKMRKYRNFQRDLKIMYMKSVFNCINEYLIEFKSSNAFMNARSSIGPGQLSLAIKQYNESYQKQQYQSIIKQSNEKVQQTIKNKCSIPSFKNYKDIEIFQNQILKQIKVQAIQNQFKWVNYMDQVLQIWQDLCTCIIQQMLEQACNECGQILK